MPRIDDITKQRIEADICLLYYQLADYCCFMPDLDYSQIFNREYWEYLDLEEVYVEDRFFIRDGCLVMILLMCLESLEGCGTYIQSRLEICERRLACCVPADEKTARLLTTVQLAVRLARDGEAINRELEESLGWVYGEYVSGYFRGMVEKFD